MEGLTKEETPTLDWTPFTGYPRVAYAGHLVTVTMVDLTGFINSLKLAR
jgi:hypothetical protein